MSMRGQRNERGCEAIHGAARIPGMMKGDGGEWTGEFIWER